MASNNDKVQRSTADEAFEIYEARREGKAWKDIELDFNMSQTTARAILERHGFDHTPHVERKPTSWTKPCLRCGDDKPRRINLWLCKSCTNDNRTQYSAPDHMYHGSESASPAKGKSQWD